MSATDLFVRPELRDGTFALQAGSGVRTARIWVDWYRVERSRGRYDFSRYDPVFEDAARNRLRVLPVLIGPPDFYTEAPEDARGWYPPSDPATMGRFAGALVHRYGPRGSFWAERPHLPRFGVHAWQVWNEPNIYPWWSPEPDAAGYVRLLREVRSHVLQADPDAEIVAAGLPNSSLGPRVRTYLADLYRAGGKGVWDTLALHPYDRTPEEVLEQIDEARDIMARHGDAAPIWVTEFGWASDGPDDQLNVGYEGQAEAVGEALAELAARRSSLGIRGFTYYHWGDGPKPAGANASVWFHVGLVDKFGEPKPSLGAYAQGVAAMGLPPLVPDPAPGGSTVGPAGPAGPARRDDAFAGPRLSGIRLKPTRFRAARAGAPLAAATRCRRARRCRRVGSTLRFHTNVDATVTLRFARLSRGSAKRLRGRIRLRVEAGPVKARLRGRLRGRRLRPGGYRLILQAADAHGRESAPGTRPFRIRR